MSLHVNIFLFYKFCFPKQKEITENSGIVFHFGKHFNVRLIEDSWILTSHSICCNVLF